ncbi:MAG: hypothetical protein KDI62_09550, partial [Anaerolineae bacterium]|nr:hypothetical protein [Anaerolineae bacterium]
DFSIRCCLCELHSYAQNDTFPVCNDPVPIKNDTFPVCNNPFPIRNGSFPNQIEAFPVRNAPFPNQNEGFPICRIAFPIRRTILTAAKPFLPSPSHSYRPPNGSYHRRIIPTTRRTVPTAAESFLPIIKRYAASIILAL